jgi:hypothetical protein
MEINSNSYPLLIMESCPTMRNESIIKLIVIPAFVAMVILAGNTSAIAEDGFKDLFNGKSLKGWSGDEELWSVEDGVILGKTGTRKLRQNTFLSTKKSYSDFVLRVKVNLKNNNSGIQFRSKQLPNFVVAGYQAYIADNEYYGMLYEEKKRGFMPYWSTISDEEKAGIAAAVKRDDWNQYEIICVGDHLKMILNGHTVLNIMDPDGAKEGIIALQLHTGPSMEVRFKDLKIRTSKLDKYLEK